MHRIITPFIFANTSIFKNDILIFSLSIFQQIFIFTKFLLLIITFYNIKNKKISLLFSQHMVPHVFASPHVGFVFIYTFYYIIVYTLTYLYNRKILVVRNIINFFPLYVFIFFKCNRMRLWFNMAIIIFHIFCCVVT